MIISNINCVWRALGSQLSGEIREVIHQLTPEGHQIEAIELIRFFLELNSVEKPTVMTKNLLAIGLTRANSLE